ncbi:MAG: ACT domain-containing protein, partial [Candidatus Methylomirabilales bacterium]
GRDALIKAIRRAGLPVQKAGSEEELAPVAEEMKFQSLEALYVSVGEGKLSPQAVVNRLVRRQVELLDEAPEAPAPPRAPAKRGATRGVVVKGIDGVEVKLSRCCMPVPGDAIVGFITRGRGISVHRSDCPNLSSLSTDGERIIEVSWDGKGSGTFPVSIQVEALDRPKLLRDVSTAISDYGVNILSATSAVGRGIAALRFTFELAEPSQLDRILNSVRKVEAVYDAYRLTPRRR